MTLYDKIKSIYPQLIIDDFSPFGSGIIILQNDGNGDYIKSWTHPTLTQPTQAQLDAIQ